MGDKLPGACHRLGVCRQGDVRQRRATPESAAHTIRQIQLFFSLPLALHDDCLECVWVDIIVAVMTPDAALTDVDD